MRTWFALAASMMLLGLTNSVSAQTSGSSGIFSPSSFMRTPSIFSNLMSGSRPSSAPFYGTTSALKLSPGMSRPTFTNVMTNRTASAPTVRFFSLMPPAKK